MNRHLAAMAFAIVLFSLAAQPAAAVDPNPLQNAYWRFEEGVNGALVLPASDVVLDSANSNLLRSPAGNEPRYTNSVAPFTLRSGLPNNLAFDFTADGGGDALHTEGGASGAKIRNGMIGAPVAPGVTGFTLEAAFRADAVGGGVFHGIVAKEGQPSGPLPTLALKVRGDTGNLQIELFDKAGALKSVESMTSLTAGHWYATAVVNDGSTLSLYLNDGSGYALQGSTAVTGALYQGASNSWDQTWAVGRAAFGGVAADWFDGIIDEVRLSNRPLAVNEFLFKQVPEPSTIALGAFALIGMAAHARRRRTMA